MVFHLPNASKVWSYTDYTDLFAFTISWNLALLEIALLVCFLVTFMFRWHALKLHRQKLSDRQSLIPQNQQPTVSILTTEEHQKNLATVRPSPYYVITTLLRSFFFYCLWVNAALTYLLFFMFGYFGKGTAVDIVCVLAMVMIVALPGIFWKQITNRQWRRSKKEMIMGMSFLVIWLGMCIALVIMGRQVCACYFNQNYGFRIDPNAFLSTEFTRSITISPPCPQNTLCHIYATLPQETSTSVFFNAHTGTSLTNLTFLLRLNGTVVSQKFSVDPFRLDKVDKIGRRLVHSVLFDGLKPGTTYQLQVQSDNSTLLKSVNYKTVPGQDADTLRLAVGGDVGMTHKAIRLTRNLKYFNPDAILLGGDTVYDNGFRNCWYSWDNFYQIFQPLNDDLDRLVPLILSVGNHDVGFDALSQNEIDNTTDGIPLFFAYNPQHVSPEEPGKVPGVTSRQPMHYHKLGRTLHFMLDSGYTRSYSQQADYIRQVMSHVQDKYYLFANYHNPIYPTCVDMTEGSNHRAVIDEGTKHWVPLFEELNFTAAMEHHTHYMKMTHPLRNESKVEVGQGVKYIGDGSWGVHQSACPASQLTPKEHLMRNYTNSDPTHLWQLTLKGNKLRYTAIDEEGNSVIESVDQLPDLEK